MRLEIAGISKESSRIRFASYVLSKDKPTSNSCDRGDVVASGKVRNLRGRLRSLANVDPLVKGYLRVIKGSYRVYIGFIRLMEQKMETAI